MKLFGTNGIRGVANKELTPNMAMNIGLAIGSYFSGKKFIVGMDARITGEMLKQAVTSGLIATGNNIVDIGYIPTPGLQYVVRKYTADAGVMITASHNPPQFNGIKLVLSDGVEADKETEAKIEQIYFNEEFKIRPWNKVGTYAIDTIAKDTYIKGILKQVNVEKIKKRKLKVVIDCSNSVGALITPYVMRQLGSTVITINSHIDGTFPGRNPEPTPENLVDLIRTVKATGADFGIAHDGDADRAIFIDEKGNYIWGDQSFAMVTKYILSGTNGETIVTPVSSGKLIEEIAQNHNAKIHWTKVGSINVSRAILETNAIIGGEENGGIFLPQHQPVRDGAMTTAFIANLITDRNMSLSEIVAELPKYYNHKIRVECPNELKQKALKIIQESTKDYKTVTIDGVKIYDRDGWVLIRPSGTEPIFRIFAESTSQNKAEELCKFGEKLLKEALEKLG